MDTALAFFDIDGTLSVPRFRQGSEFVAGFPDAEWLAFCAENGENAYDDCLPVAPVRRYAEKLKKAGACLFVLTTSLSEAETRAKKKFVRDNFPGIFEEFIAVDSDRDKPERIKEQAENSGVTLPQCELIEDTYAILLSAMAYGIKTTHISGIVRDL